MKQHELLNGLGRNRTVAALVASVALAGCSSASKESGSTTAAKPKAQPAEIAKKPKPVTTNEVVTTKVTTTPVETNQVTTTQVATTEAPAGSGEVMEGPPGFPLSVDVIHKQGAEFEVKIMNVNREKAGLFQAGVTASDGEGKVIEPTAISIEGDGDYKAEIFTMQPQSPGEKPLDIGLVNGQGLDPGEYFSINVTFPNAKSVYANAHPNGPPELQRFSGQDHWPP